jgi:hypothetical protein
MGILVPERRVITVVGINMHAEELHNVQIYSSPNSFKGIKSRWVRRMVILYVWE